MDWVINYIKKEVISFFKEQDSFTREELFNQYLKFEPNLKPGTFGWRVYELKKQNLIRELGRGIYTCKTKEDYKTRIKQNIVNLIDTNQVLFEQANMFFKINLKFMHIFNSIEYCIWNTEWLNEFTDLQSTKNYIILEVEKDMLETIFYHIKDEITENIFLKSDYKFIEKYGSDKNTTVIIKNTITRSPIEIIQLNEGYPITVPKLEKILVDIKADRNIFFFLSNSEIQNIINRSSSKYALNTSLLSNYAGRRIQDLDDYLGLKYK